jgi:hypothetical protein
MKRLVLLFSALLFAVPVQAEEPSELLPPVQVQAGGRPLDIERVGHSAPFVGDFYEDGTLTLLVGQYHEGRLRIYRNTGTRTQPKFESYEWFKAGGAIASVPVG